MPTSRCRRDSRAGIGSLRNKQGAIHGQAPPFVRLQYPDNGSPGSTTVILSIIVFILGVIGFIFPYTAILGQLSFWLCLAGYLLLLAGVLMKGL